MRRERVGWPGRSGLILAAVLAWGLYGAAGAWAAGGDSASGIIGGQPTCGGRVCIRTDTAFDVHGGPSGENPVGTVEQFVDGSGAVHGIFESSTGAVTCLNVIGNRAAIGFVATPTPGFSNPGIPGYATLIVEDNGSAGTDQSATLSSTEPVTTCPDPRTVTLQPITVGDSYVHDALTGPQARAACLAERGSLGRRAFRAKYGNPAHALRNCINQKQA
jgi:hypothetical protein